MHLHLFSPPIGLHCSHEPITMFLIALMAFLRRGDAMNARFAPDAIRTFLTRLERIGNLKPHPTFAFPNDNRNRLFFGRR